MKIFCSCEGYRLGDIHHVFNRLKPILKTFQDKSYGEEFIDIGVIPVIMPEEFHDRYKERKLLKRKKREADIRLFIDYDKFSKADLDMQVKLFLQNIIRSIKVVDERKKGDFQGEKLINDLCVAFNVEREQIESL